MLLLKARAGPETEEDRGQGKGQNGAGKIRTLHSVSRHDGIARCLPSARQSPAAISTLSPHRPAGKSPPSRPGKPGLRFAWQGHRVRPNCLWVAVLSCTRLPSL